MPRLDFQLVPVPLWPPPTGAVEAEYVHLPRRLNYEVAEKKKKTNPGHLPPSPSQSHSSSSLQAWKQGFLNGASTLCLSKTWSPSSVNPPCMSLSGTMVTPSLELLSHARARGRTHQPQPMGFPHRSFTHPGSASIPPPGGTLVSGRKQAVCRSLRRV